jgi:hypothetical protein
MGRESNGNLFHQIRVCFEEVLLERSGRNTERAESVKDWFIKSSHFSHVGVNV